MVKNQPNATMHQTVLNWIFAASVEFIKNTHGCRDAHAVEKETEGEIAWETDSLLNLFDFQCSSHGS